MENRKIFCAFRNKKKGLNRPIRFLKLVYYKLFRINDSPQKIALGLGIGVFSGIMPGTGIFAAVFLAYIFRINRASALLGSILTNTWLSLSVFLVALKIGAVLMGIRYGYLYQGWQEFLKDFKWTYLFKISVFKIVVPVFIGYFCLSICAGVIAYAVSLSILNFRAGIKMKKV